jgi:hypothetical protein
MQMIPTPFFVPAYVDMNNQDTTWVFDHEVIPEIEEAQHHLEDGFTYTNNYITAPINYKDATNIHELIAFSQENKLWINQQIDLFLDKINGELPEEANDRYVFQICCVGETETTYFYIIIDEMEFVGAYYGFVEKTTTLIIAESLILVMKDQVANGEHIQAFGSIKDNQDLWLIKYWS